MQEKINICWLRRDLRLEDNTALTQALAHPNPVLLIFIFDENIVHELPRKDPRITFIHQQLEAIHNQLRNSVSSLLVKKGNPLDVWKGLTEELSIENVFFNHDYEPYALQRDKEITGFLTKSGTEVQSFKDQVIFEKNEVVKGDGNPYTVFTPFKKCWLSQFNKNMLSINDIEPVSTFVKSNFPFPSLEDLGFEKSNIEVLPYNLSRIDEYGEKRDFPSESVGSVLGPHLRFGTVSVRQIIKTLTPEDSIFLSELIWREFFMQILFHFPHVVEGNFRKKYDGIEWKNDEADFKRWCEGNTGYPIVDAGMRQLNQTGYMHNRVRMVVASFLCKHLLIDWKWGEAYFAEKLLDFDLSANNGNWQWAAGTGCDAAPYFRVFNPTEQTKKFDKQLEYIRKWVPEIDEFGYPEPMVDHKFARERALATYKKGIEAAS